MSIKNLIHELEETLTNNSSNIKDGLYLKLQNQLKELYLNLDRMPEKKKYRCKFRLTQINITPNISIDSDEINDDIENLLDNKEIVLQEDLGICEEVIVQDFFFKEEDRIFLDAKIKDNLFGIRHFQIPDRCLELQQFMKTYPTFKKTSTRYEIVKNCGSAFFKIIRTKYSTLTLFEIETQELI